MNINSNILHNNSVQDDTDISNILSDIELDVKNSYSKSKNNSNYQSLSPKSTNNNHVVLKDFKDNENDNDNLLRNNNIIEVTEKNHPNPEKNQDDQFISTIERKSSDF